ncbi:MAG: type II secretion system F family protein [Planctomycetes bacterium]|nr:type II secretion system F family protein [Planctomycetota bacterium]
MLSIAADERAALEFDELASTLDAGLPLATLGGRGEHGDRVVHVILQQRGVDLSPSDDVVLQAAWRSGRIGPALRARAGQRRQRAELRRQMLLGLAYPAALYTMAIVAAFATAPILGHHGFAIALLVLLAALVAATLVLVRGLRTGGERWNRLPWVGRMATDLAEIPYLEVLQALYGAGVPVVEAHAGAVAAVPNAAVRQRLTVAGRVLGSGRTLGEALAESLALHAETRTLLANGERAGQLEESLHRALERRRDTAQRQVRRLGRSITLGIYAVAALTAVLLIFQFYSRLYGGAFGRR